MNPDALTTGDAFDPWFETVRCREEVVDRRSRPGSVVYRRCRNRTGDATMRCWRHRP